MNTTCLPQKTESKMKICFVIYMLTLYFPHFTSLDFTHADVTTGQVLVPAGNSRRS